MLRWLIIILLLVPLFANAQGDQVWLHPNRGQWDNRIAYKVELDHGSFLIEPKGFTYHFYDYPSHDHGDQPNDMGDSKENHHDEEAEIIRNHVIKTAFIGANYPESTKESKKSSFYRNYFLTENNANWKSEVYSVQEVIQKNLYPGIDLQMTGGIGYFKYNWIVAPGADYRNIVWQYTGAEKIALNKFDEIEIAHSLGVIREGKPIAWRLVNGKKQSVKVEYVLEGDKAYFRVAGNAILTDTLIIDPTLTFSTFTGSTNDNWGFTAAPDPSGNLFAAGIVFNDGATYPTTPGAFDQSINGSMETFDIGITKFNSTGTALLYSTFLGGNSNETPHSIVCDSNGELYIFGVTSSSNFPVTAGSLDQSYNGGPAYSGSGLSFPNGSDIFVARLNVTGTTLLASTYIGGSSTDGLQNGALRYNYGDDFRGEIIIDDNSVYVATVTSSSDFPVANAMQASLNGTQDAVFFKMNNTLSAFQWCTYFGGSGLDAGNGIEVSSAGDVYVSGGTNSTSLGFASGYDLTYNGGIADGFLARLNSGTGALQSGTYIGTTDYDQSYFVQLDQDDAVYVYGQTQGTMPITPGCYGVSNSGQFVAKYATNLATLSWTTTVGAGTGNVEISPTAFLVSNCKDIYLSGWGGTVNTSSQATSSSSNGFPVTPDAYQSGTNGSNFWIAVLDEDAAFLKYATFMGGVNSSANHVDGGTSRFDKNGSIYHVVCAACQGNNTGFTTTPGVWSPQNPSPNCNLAAFKFELSNIEAIVSDPDPIVCLPDPVLFINNSSNGNDFQWDFGDNTTSTEVNPSHVYPGAGQYTVTLIVSDTNECFVPDTIQFIVNIGDFQGGIVQPPASICPGVPYQFEAYGGGVYEWSPAQFLNNPNIANPIANITENTQFTCIISDSCGIDTVSVWLNVFGGEVQVSNDTAICIGNSVPLEVVGLASATWAPPTFLDDPNSTTPISTPTSTITYNVSGTTIDGCALTESVTITVVLDFPNPVMPDTLTYCENLSGVLTVSGADSYAWAPPVDITPLNGPTVTISSPVERYYYCVFSNACGSETDSVWANIVSANVNAGNDTIVCPGEPVFMWASGGVSYLWQPAVTPIDPTYSQVSAVPQQAGNYVVYGTDQYGCIDSANVFIALYPQPFIQTNPDVYAMMGELVQLSAQSTTPGPYVWSPAEYLSCLVCENPVAQPDQNYVYTVTYTDANGCSASDDVRIIYDPIIYVPNAFTPDGNSLNSDFFAVGGNIKDFRIDIFNRWGELIYTGDALDKAWDGTYQGKPCQDGVYVWKIKYYDFLDQEYQLVGHVSLLR